MLSDDDKPRVIKRRTRNQSWAPLEERSLVMFVQALQGTKVVVELQNDTMVRGQLQSVDPWMNMIISEATLKSFERPERKCSWLHLRGRRVRYIHFPSSIDPLQQVKDHRYRLASDHYQQVTTSAINPPKPLQDR